MASTSPTIIIAFEDHPMDDEMTKALEADGEKLRQLTGEDHGPFDLIEFAKLGAPLSDTDRVMLSTAEVACYRWPDDTIEHRALRAAFMEGAATVALAMSNKD
jgi:hypothetical protein